MSEHRPPSNDSETSQGTTDRVVCVVGGTSGIGRACVEQFLADGCFVVAVGRNEEHIDALVRDLAFAEDRLITHRADCSTLDGCQEVASLVEEHFGHLDVLVNAFGIIRLGGVPQVNVDDWELVLQTNLSGVFYMTRSCTPLLERSRKSPAIINVSSSCTARPCPSVSYTVSKAAVEMLTTCSARDLAPKGIRVNAVAPGLTETNMQLAGGAFSSRDEQSKFLRDKAGDFPLGRTGLAEDTANAVVFLASELSSWTTGAILRVDGGISSTGATTYKEFEGRKPATARRVDDPN
jgi:NAD(P)-dependent dehydrogenase (short-subunit alcohol dehydrogenase family)